MLANIGPFQLHIYKVEDISTIFNGVEIKGLYLPIIYIAIFVLIDDPNRTDLTTVLFNCSGNF